MVTRLEVQLREGDVASSQAAMREDRERRRRSQPLDRPTFGSTFTNPPGDHAGRLIEAAGLKGHRVGNATWSDVHANFIVNLGGATAADVLALIRLARARVRERFGIRLETEVRFMGEFLAGEVPGGSTEAGDEMNSKWKGRKVAVLYGGRSTEREVSLDSGKACGEALRSRGHDVVMVDVDLDVAGKLREAKAEVAFIALHGRWGEDGCIQGLLESMGIPYTGSGVLASSVGMDKVFSKVLFRDASACESSTTWSSRRPGPHRHRGETCPSASPAW